MSLFLWRERAMGEKGVGSVNEKRAYETPWV